MLLKKVCYVHIFKFLLNCPLEANFSIKFAEVISELRQAIYSFQCIYKVLCIIIKFRVFFTHYIHVLIKQKLKRLYITLLYNMKKYNHWVVPWIF